MDVATRLSCLSRGLVLVTGVTGSGKSTTLAAMIDYLNKTSARHVITLEDPIEYLHLHSKSIVNQREVGTDVVSFVSGLRDALREDPDVVLVGEMRDLETISTALTAAETGHLVLSTLHTSSAAGTIERIIDIYPPHQQQQVKVQLASTIQGVLSQQLLPRIDNQGRVCAVEIMMATPAIRANIRDGKVHQLNTAMQTGAEHNMVTMDRVLADLAKRRVVSESVARSKCVDKVLFSKYLNG